MARKRVLPEDQLRHLRNASETLVGSELVDVLESAVTSSSCVVVEYAAKLVVELGSPVSANSLHAAYQRFLVAPLEKDKGCRAKLPLAEALAYLEYDDPDFYLAGMKYTQFEPVWGGTEDTAGNLRGACALGLVRCPSASQASTMIALVDLLSEKDRLARMLAATAITNTGSPAVVPILRLKASLGDAAPEVMGECFRGLLRHAASTNIEFIARFLSGEAGQAIEAATALGECRNEHALAALLNACVICESEVREAFYTSAALSKHAAAIQFLTNLISQNSLHAEVALKALAPMRFYAEISQQVNLAVKASEQEALSAAYQRLFES